MEESGIGSFNTSGSVDLSLEGLELSPSNHMASCPNDSGIVTAPTAADDGTCSDRSDGDGEDLIHGSLSKEEVYSPDQDGGDLQSIHAHQKQVPIAELLHRTGYSIVQANGQRRYGPPPNWEGPIPQRGCEVFVGKVPRDCFEDELVPVFERVGKIYEMRLMLDHYTGLNRGYCFVVFANSSEAKECVRQLNTYEIRKGRTLGICMSVDNCRLFVGGIPKKVTKDDILMEMQKVTEGVMDVIVYPSASDKTKNRGFAFVEYESHRSAAMARRKLMNGRVDLWGHNIAVDWAEPELEVDEEIMAQVKVLYVRNLMLSTTEVQILDAFSVYGVVERVKKIKDYAFVHFQNREEAYKGMEAVNGTVLDGALVEVTLAKPVDKDNYLRSPKLGRSFSVPAFYVPVDQYGSILPFYPSYYSSSTPKYMLRNSMGACGMVQVPRPPGRGAVSPSPIRGGGGGGGGGGVGGIYYPVAFTSPTPRYMYSASPVRATVPYYPAPPQTNYYEQPVNVVKRTPDAMTCPMQDGMAGGRSLVEVPPQGTQQASPVKPKTSCSMVLESICHKNNWGSPLYTLHTSTSTSVSGEASTLFLYKLSVVGIGMTYIPSKLSHVLAEAREIAAEHALVNLGYPVEASGRLPFPNPLVPAFQYTTTDPSSPVCPPPASFVAISGGPKPPGAWGGMSTPGDHGIYTTNYPENHYPQSQAYSPEFYQPVF